MGDNAIHKVVLAQKCDNNSQGFQYKNPPPTLQFLLSYFWNRFNSETQKIDSEMGEWLFKRSSHERFLASKCFAKDWQFRFDERSHIIESDNTIHQVFADQLSNPWILKRWMRWISSHVIFTGAAEKLRWKGISESLGSLLAKLIALSQEGKPARGAGLSEKELEALKAPGARGFTWWWDDRSLEF